MIITKVIQLRGGNSRTLELGSKWVETKEFGQLIKDPYRGFCGVVDEITPKVVWLNTEEGRVGIPRTQFFDRFELKG